MRIDYLFLLLSGYNRLTVLAKEMTRQSPTCKRLENKYTPLKSSLAF